MRCLGCSEEIVDPRTAVYGEHVAPGGAFHAPDDQLDVPVKEAFHPQCFPVDNPHWIRCEKIG